MYEKELEQLLISKLQEFLLGLGKGFSFVTRQYRISTEESGKHELNHQDIGQMDFYVRYFEDKVRQIFASKYRLYLPSEDELTRELEREKHEIETERSLQNAE